MLLCFIHIHKVYKVFIWIARSVEKGKIQIVTSLRADENGLFVFLGRKKATNNYKANWSEVNRNGLHSLEVSLDLEDNSIIF